MTTEDLFDLFRSEMSDTVEPYLWSNNEVLSYIDDAQKMLCRLTEGIEDARTPDIVEIDVVPATEWYPLSPLVLKIRDAVRSDNGHSVTLINQERMRERCAYFDGRVGPLNMLVQGMDKHALRAWPVPNETVTVNLTVFRLPLLTVDDFDVELEVDEQHHRHLLLWMKSLAYDKQDAETIDRTKSREFDAKFRGYCDAARREQERVRWTNQPVAYGGL